MTGDPIFEREGSRVLTHHAFGFVLDSELKRAGRARAFLTLVLFEARVAREDAAIADTSALDGVSHVVGRGVRDTDLMARTEDGALALVLLDADFDSSARVIDRLSSRFDAGVLPAPIRITVGAACFPTHARDAVSLRRWAVLHPVATLRGTPPPGA